MARFGKASASTNVNPNGSTEVVQPPSDSVSSLSFSPKANVFVATSWDNEVRCWEVIKSGSNLNTVPKASISHGQPVLCSAWKDDGSTVFSGGCDRQVKMWPIASGGQPVTVAMHDAPVKELLDPRNESLSHGKLGQGAKVNPLVSSIEYWDLRKQSPTWVQQLPERCYALSVQYPLMVVGTADRNMTVFNLQNPQTEYKRVLSPLNYQTRCLAAFPDKQGFVVGSIEGRVGVHYLDKSQKSNSFTFRCHRDGKDVYSINSLNFHPTHHTVATAGSDGAFNFWDIDRKQKLKAMLRCNQPITCSSFNHDGSIFAYSACYDWSKGAENHKPATVKTNIYLHQPQEADVAPRARK